MKCKFYTVLTVIFFSVFLSFSLSAREYAVGDVMEKDGVSYKVLVSYLVVDSKESPDTIKGPGKFYYSGELMAIKVDENLKDVVIPPTVGRFKVVGLTDSLFYGHTHDRIWLPELMFVGNRCFAKLKVGSGALVIHNIHDFGVGVFEDLEADLIFDITKKVNLEKAFQNDDNAYSVLKSKPKGLVKFNTRMLGHAKSCSLYDDCYSATADNYKKWIDKAFNNDAEFKKNDLFDKNVCHNKRTYSTTPIKNKKGLTITSGAENVKKLGYPWGSLTNDYYRQAKYSVYNKKSKKTSYFKEFAPVVDASKKEGWYVRFVGDEGEVKYMLNGKVIKK